MDSIDPRDSKRKIRETVIKNDRQALKESAKRQDRLQKLAVLHTGDEVYVQLSGDSAWADIADESSKLGHTDRVIINVRLDIPDQEVTNLDPEMWDLMVQKTDLYHEIGHYLYTDWPALEKVIYGDGSSNYGVTEEHQSMFKNWFDTIEDAAIEPSVAERFDMEDEFKITNENLLANAKPAGTVSLHEAVMIRLIEFKHPTGWTKELMNPTNDELEFLTSDDKRMFEDEILPVLERDVPRIIEEPDAELRPLMVYALYEQIGIFFDDSVKPGTDENHSFNFPEDTEKMNIGAQGGKKPESSGGQPNDPQSQNQSQGQGQNQGSAKTIDFDKQQDYRDQLEQEQDSMRQSEKAESIETWGRVIDHSYDNGTTLSLKVPDIPPEKGQYNDSTYQEALRLSKPLAKELGNRLHHQQKTQKKTGQKSGKVDPKRAHKTAQGKINVFSRHSDPNEKDYAAILVTDRSGSMSTEMVHAEESVGALAIALEEIGVSVSVLSIASGEVNLEKDFAEDVKDARERMFRGYNAGGTPLSDVLMMARMRLEMAGEHPFVIVVTDGEPDHREAYREQLHMCDFPVLGVYLDQTGNFNESHMNENSYFHALEMREYTNAIDGVKNMIKSVMF